MKKLLIFVLMATMEPGFVFAGSAQCYSIKDSDLKYYCLAIEKNSASQCYAIKGRDIKNSCLARIKKQKIHCYQIQSTDQKQQCLSSF